MAGEMSALGNVKSGKRLSGKTSGRESLRRRIYSVSKSVREIFVGALSVKDLSLENCLLGNSPVGELSTSLESSIKLA